MVEKHGGFLGTLSSLAKECAAQTRVEFLAAHTVPFLVQMTGDSGPADTSSFGTMVLEPEHPTEPAAFKVFELSKRHANPFAEMVTVGRAANNDVVLTSPTVSKFHAFLRATPQGWIVVDAQSTNGTRVDGEKLVPAHIHKLDLEHPVDVRFGNVICHLVSPPALWDAMEAFDPLRHKLAGVA